MPYSLLAARPGSLGRFGDRSMRVCWARPSSSCSSDISGRPLFVVQKAVGALIDNRRAHIGARGCQLTICSLLHSDT
jgi:hypothetical protein